MKKALRIPVPVDESPELDKERIGRRAARDRYSFDRWVQSEQRFLEDSRETDGNRWDVTKERCPCDGTHRGMICKQDDKSISAILCPRHVYTVRLRGWIREQVGIKIQYEDWMKQFA